MDKKQDKTKNKENLPECCKQKSKGIKVGLLSGIIPHTGCIAIILFALLGVTAANTFFIKFLSNKYYIYIVFAISLGIATLAAFFYIRRFSNKRLGSHWKYISFLYISVIAINLLMIYIIFPYAFRIGSENSEGDMLKLDFNGLPCSGHIPLVISELEKVGGINSVKFIEGKAFEVYYDNSRISKKQILEQDICKEFNAKEE